VKALRTLLDNTPALQGRNIIHLRGYPHGGPTALWMLWRLWRWPR